MAERRGTGGRGSTGTLPEGLDLADFVAVPEEENIDRSRTEASKYAPLVDMAKQHPGQQFEHRVPVMENGEPKRDEETGEIVRQPVTYTGAEAKAFASELRNAGNRARLVRKGYSLRIVGSTPLAKVEDGDTGVRVQWYVIKLQKGQSGQPDEQ